MTTMQIQLPDPVYDQVQRIAREYNWSIAEVIEHGVESIVNAYPSSKQKSFSSWKLPEPIPTRLLVEDPSQLKEIILEECS